MLLNLIGALDAPTAGTIRLNGQGPDHRVAPQRTMIRRHTVSFVFQSFSPTTPAQAGLLVPGTVRSHGRAVDVAAEVLPAGAAWTPQLSAGRLAGGLVLSRKAAADLSASIGSVVTFRHPQAVGGGLRTADTRVRVAGIDPSPMRTTPTWTPARRRRCSGCPG